MGIDGNEFPQKEATEATAVTFTLPIDEVVKSVDKTIFAVGTEDIRPIMMGILWDIKPNEIVFVASDTHKLVRYRNLRVATEMEASFILPPKPASILHSVLVKKDGHVQVTIDSKFAPFGTDSYTFTCRFVTRKDPNYITVIT